MPDFIDLVQRRCTSRFFALIMLLAGLCATPARADCHALQVLPDIIVEVEHLARLADNTAIATSGHQLAVLRQQINKNTMYQRLEPLGMEFSLPDIMRLKVKLGVLSQFAINNGLQKTYSYMRGSDFLRSYDPVRSLVLYHCAARTAGEGLTPGQSALLGSSRQTAANTPVNTTATSGSSGDATGTKTRPISAGEKLLGAGTSSIIIIGVIAAWLGHKQRLWRRRSKRYPCDIAVSLTAAGQVISCTVVDLSQSGANLEIDTDLEADDLVTIEFGKLTRQATIIWSNSKYAGIKFDRRLRRDEFHLTLECSTFETSLPAKRKTTLQGASFQSIWSRLRAAIASAFKQQRQ